MKRENYRIVKLTDGHGKEYYRIQQRVIFNWWSYIREYSYSDHDSGGHPAEFNRRMDAESQISAIIYAKKEKIRKIEKIY